MNNSDFHNVIKTIQDDYEQILNAEPPTYEDTFFKDAVDDMERRLDEKIRKSSLESRILNLVIIAISIASLVVGIISIVFQSV